MKFLKGIIASIILTVMLNVWATTFITLTWTAPSEREDGTGLALSEIAGYHIYYGTTAGDYQNTIIIDDFTATEYVFAEMPPATYYLVITTIDTDGRESVYSNEVIVVIPNYFASPNPITNLLLSVGSF